MLSICYHTKPPISLNFLKMDYRTRVLGFESCDLGQVTYFLSFNFLLCKQFCCKVLWEFGVAHRKCLVHFVTHLLHLVTQSCLTLCDPMGCSMRGFTVLHHLLELAQTQVHWCHPTVSSSVVPFFSCLQSCPASGSFLMSQLFASGSQSIGASASASVLLMNIQDWFPLGLTGLISLQSRGLSRVFSNTTVQKQQFFGFQPSLWSNSHIHTWLLKKP